ncbi:MAG TPA: polyprenol phosphomannose-dependent alpha 1,6 mannosyltransferase MptB [Microlunatus sp.]|nr:polyprenol phosphomannose-dependent alpha 1,6 mannosyltransferase MptB [Microlunatus sp.]
MSTTTGAARPRSAGATPYLPEAWHRDHRVGLGLIVGATVLTLITGFLGPSAVTLTLGPRDGFLPPWYLPDSWVEPNEWLVSSLIWAVIIIGGVGLTIALRALSRGWRPNHRKIFALGTGLSLATILVPVMTSADILMYAAYGRLQVTGRNPYDTTPAEIFRTLYDPVLKRIEPPWWDVPSVYGPITSWTQWAANMLGGENMHDIVFWLQVFCVAPFILAGAGMVLLARGDRTRQARTALLTVCNPLLIWAVVAAGHNEAMSVMFAVGGLLLMRRSAFGAGIGIGLAGCAKLSIGLWGLAMLWAYRKEPKKAALLCLGTLIPMGLCYGLWQPTALVKVLNNTSYVSVGSWPDLLFRLMGLFPGPPNLKKIILNIICYSVMILVVWLLSRVLPWTAAPGWPKDADPRTDPVTVTLRTAVLLAVGWLATSTYTLSWYDLIAWMPLAVLAPSKLDLLLILRGVALSLAFVPGRDLPMGPELDFVATRVRENISPVVQLMVLIAIILWAVRRARPDALPWLDRILYPSRARRRAQAKAKAAA